MRTMSVAILIVGLLAVAVHAEGKSKPAAPTPMFTDYLQGVSDGRAKQAAYEEAESETVCFRTQTYCQRTCPFDLCSQSSGVAYVTCAECDSSQHSSYGYKSRDDMDVTLGSDSVGKCVYTEARTDPLPLMDTTNVLVLGTFTGVCYIKDTKGTCTSGACDDVIISITGTIYNVTDAIVDGAPVFTTLPQYCPTTGGPRFGSTFAAREEEPQQAKVQYSRENIISTGLEYHGPALVYVGPMTVVSHHHATKYSKGIFQHSFFPTGATQADAATLQGLPRLADDLYKLKLVAEDKAHY